jgi:hypothetical protein
MSYFSLAGSRPICSRFRFHSTPRFRSRRPPPSLTTAVAILRCSPSTLRRPPHSRAAATVFHPAAACTRAAAVTYHLHPRRRRHLPLAPAPPPSPTACARAAAITCRPHTRTAPQACARVPPCCHHSAAQAPPSHCQHTPRRHIASPPPCSCPRIAPHTRILASHATCSALCPNHRASPRSPLHFLDSVVCRDGS